MTTQKQQNRKVGVAGSFQNQIMGNNTSTPVAGGFATKLSYSDRTPFEVLTVSEDGNSCTMRELGYKFTGTGYGDEQYDLFTDVSNEIFTMEWNAKQKAWGTVKSRVEVIKSLEKRMFAEFGYEWANNLPNGLSYKDLITEESKNDVYASFKLIEGVTKEYKTFHKMSVIFGFAERYRDPSF